MGHAREPDIQCHVGLVRNVIGVNSHEPNHVPITMLHHNASEATIGHLRGPSQSYGVLKETCGVHIGIV